MAELLKDRVRDDLNAARRERDKLRTTLLTMLLSEIRNREIDLGHELADDEVQAVATTPSSAAARPPSRCAPAAARSWR
jgi:uncharacterized protein YqeY